MTDFEEIERLLDKRKNLRPLNLGEQARLREEFIIENTYNSNAIEGNSLTLRETSLVIKEGLTIGGKPLRDHLEAVGHAEALDFVWGLSKSGSPLSERDIKDIHSLVLAHDKDNAGLYRRIPVTISGSSVTPPQPYLVPKQMETLIADYKELLSARNIIEAVSEFHLRFEIIHPFIDGNGRTGRLILNLELIKSGLLPVNIKYEDIDKYYQCFDDYLKAGTSETMYNLIAKYERITLYEETEIMSWSETDN
jgi:Fic family protein